uniref:Uncharacterized protein n=1 Tax=Setaria viridis TaxID=4556 RepID=A0A4U6U2B9_SETVI|nr:hypothetical protein SEVIR_6G012450v2 [Setaria viridis]
MGSPGTCTNYSRDVRQTRISPDRTRTRRAYGRIRRANAGRIRPDRNRRADTGSSRDVWQGDDASEKRRRVVWTCDVGTAHGENTVAMQEDGQPV